MIVSAKQIAALKYLIGHAQIKNELAKKIAFFLIDNSDALNSEVAICLFEGRDGYSDGEVSDAAHALDFLRSANGTTHIDAILTAMNTYMHFSIHYGHYEENNINAYSSLGQFPGFEEHPKNAPMRYTFWFSRRSYGYESDALKLLPTPSKEELEAVSLKDGLYC